MKNIIGLILILSLQVLAQNPSWTSLKETNINASSAISFDIFSNGFGTHVIVQENSTLKYYKMDANGTAGNPITLETTSVVAPSICGDNTRLYVVYRKNNESYIRTKFSSDGGSSWTYLSTNPQNSNANSMESVFSNNKLYVSFDVSNTVYYSYYNTQNSVWSPLQTVSTGENGSVPRVAAWYTSSQDRVIFMYRKTATEGRWREWNAATNVWVNNPQTAFTVTSGNTSDPKGIAVDANYVYSYYEFTVYNPYNIYSQRQQRLRSNNAIVSTSVAQGELMVPKVYTTTTANNITHSAFYYNGTPLESGYEIGIVRNKHIGSGIEADPAYPYFGGYDQPTMINISSTTNDVFVVWKDNLSINLRLIYDDQIPLAPTNPQLSANPGNNMVRFTWTKNNEADLSVYEVWRKVNSGGTWLLINTTSNNYFVDPTYYYAPGAGDFIVTYKVRAKDAGNHLSFYSSEVSTRAEELGKQNVVNYSQLDFNLNQNYPNPFNPSTKISYSIKEEGLVTLKVYDILGKEIVTLVNENKPAGYYKAEFKASALPSGMYIYKIQAGQFSDVKKMLLTK